MRHAVTHLRDELGRLKLLEIEVKNDWDRQRNDPSGRLSDLAQIRREQDETRAAIRMIETAMGLHR